MSVPSKAVYVFVFPGFADWEPAHALAELRRHGGYRVETVARDRNPVVSMGGLSVLPSRTLAEVDTDDVAVLILPGGERWEREPMDDHLTVLIRQLERRATPIAAICAATTALVGAGLLEGRRHTSNGLAYLQAQVPDYDARASYVDAPAVRDRGVITASGLADVEFAREIFAELKVFSEADLEVWTTIFRSGRLPVEG
ncbi:MAG TPA: DJ-1/PfpI family protein [Gemmatimonadaceae bacterium]|nr:DJ-1/PfpI family protein [Gemmatimonadaceae bacterium]